MLTKNGKIVFSIVILLILGVAGAAFFLGNPGAVDLPNIVKNDDQKNNTAKLDPEILAKFEKPLSEFGLDIDGVYSNIYWSPDLSYIIFQGEPKPVAGQMEAAPRVIVGDIKNGTLKKIYDGMLVGAPSWSGDRVVFASDGVYLYDAGDGTMKVVSQSPGMSPILSRDGNKVAYADNGLVIFSIDTGASTVLSTNNGDVPALWYKDNTKILYFRSDGTNLGDGAGMRQGVSVIDLVTKESKDFASIQKGKFRRASWINEAHVHVFGGFDDGRSDYVLNLDTGTAHAFTQNVATAEHLVQATGKNVFIYNAGTLVTYGLEGNEISRANLVGSWDPANNVIPYNMRVIDGKAVFQYVPMGSKTAILRVWDATTGAPLKEIPVPEGTAVLMDTDDYYIVIKGDSSAFAIREFSL